MTVMHRAHGAHAPPTNALTATACDWLSPQQRTREHGFRANMKGVNGANLVSNKGSTATQMHARDRRAT